MSEKEPVLEFYLREKGIKKCRDGCRTFYRGKDDREIGESMLERMLQNDPSYLGLEDGFYSRPSDPHNRIRRPDKHNGHVLLYQSGYELGARLKETTSP